LRIVNSFNSFNYSCNVVKICLWFMGWCIEKLWLSFYLKQSSKKSGSWDPGSRTLFWRNPDIFGRVQKSDPFIDIWLISLPKIKHNLMANDQTIFITNIILFCELFTEIWKSDIFIPKIGSRTFVVFLELWRCLICIQGVPEIK
jgi:hypothetical protein